MRNLACALTVPQVNDRSKTVTRRYHLSWSESKVRVGDEVCLVAKGQGIPKGGTIERLAVVRVVDTRLEPLGEVAAPGELAKEGFPYLSTGDDAESWMDWWAAGHGYSRKRGDYSGLRKDARTGEWEWLRQIPVRRLEWEFVDV